MLLFYIDNERYAIESRHVVEVLPLMELKKIHQSSKSIAGLMNYHDQIIPVVDLGQVIRECPCHSYLSTRIILVNYLEADQTVHQFGLLAERVTQTLDGSEIKLTHSGIAIDNVNYLGDLIIDKQGVIQCIQVDKLITKLQQTYCLLQAEH
jgi:chemotaxis-related protein WspB